MIEIIFYFEFFLQWIKIDDCLIPVDRERWFISAVLDPWIGLASSHSVPKILDSTEVVVCLYIASLGACSEMYCMTPSSRQPLCTTSVLLSLCKWSRKERSFSWHVIQFGQAQHLLFMALSLDSDGTVLNQKCFGHGFLISVAAPLSELLMPMKCCDHLLSCWVWVS